MVPDTGVSSEVEESFSRGVFFSRQNLQVARCYAKGPCLPGAHCEKIALSEHGFFFLTSLLAIGV